MSQDFPEFFDEVLNEFMIREHRSLNWLAKATGIPKPTLRNWKEGKTRRPRDWRDILRISAALHLSLAETDRLLLAAHHPSIARLQNRNTDADDVVLLSHWAVQIERHSLIPELPDYFQFRDEDLTQLKALVLDQDERLVATAGKQPAIGIQGMGGVGKTLLAAALAHAPDIRNAFPDGIYWLTLGYEPQLLNRQVELAQLLGDDKPSLVDVNQATTYLRKLLSGKKCLLVLDDVWHTADANALNVVDTGSGSQLLVTTRDSSVLTGLRARELRLNVLDRNQSMSLLAELVGLDSVDNLSPEAGEVAERCEYLPLALVVCGANVADGYLWQDLLAALDKAKLDYLDHEHGSIMATLQSSIDRLPETEGAVYQTFAIFPGDMPLPEDMLVTFWKHYQRIEPFEVRGLITTLERRALLNTKGTPGNRLITLHDLLHLYLRQHSENNREVHQQWLEAYRAQLVLVAGTTNWAEGPNDGYFFQQLTYHLRWAGQQIELEQLLLNYEWLQAKLKATDVYSLIADYEQITKTNRHSILHLVQGAIRLSEHVLVWDKDQLAGQLYGRLLGKSPETDSFLNRIRAYKGVTWLCPTTSSLLGPGNLLLRTIIADHISDIAITPNGENIVSASLDGTIKIWNLRSGEELCTLGRHEDAVWRITVSPDGRRAISGSRDGTLKIWDLEARKELQTLRGHSDGVTGIAVTPDGSKIISSSSDATLRIWDLTGKLNDRLWTITQDGHLTTISGHGESVSDVAITPDGQRIISASRDKTIKIWDFVSKKLLRTLSGHRNEASRVVVLPDNRHLISGEAEWNPKIRVWDLDTGAEKCTFDKHYGHVNTIAITPDGKLALSASGSMHDAWETTIKVWEIDNGVEVSNLYGHGAPVDAIAVTPDGKQAISASYVDGTIRVWDLSNLQSESRGIYPYPIQKLLITPDKRFLIVIVGPDWTPDIDGSHSIHVLNLENKTESSVLEQSIYSFKKVGLTSDGHNVFALSDGGNFTIWNIESGRVLLKQRYPHDGYISNILQKRPETIITGSSDDTAKVLELKSDNPVLMLNEHKGDVHTINLMSDNSKIVSVSRDSLRVWDIQSGKSIASFVADNDLRACAIVPTENRILVGDNSGQLHDLQLIEIQDNS